MSERYKHHNNKHVIIAAACKLENDLIIVGTRHFDSLMRDQLKTIYGEDTSNWPTPAETNDQGFIDNRQQYLSREDAAKVAYEAGQVPELYEQLFSEDLY